MSMLLVVLSSLRLPFLQTIYLLYLFGLTVLANSLLGLNYPRVVVGTLVLVCGLLPTLYDHNGVRVIREVATGGLELAIFGVCLTLYRVKTTQPARQLLRSPTFFVLLALLGFHWSLREEAALLLPAVLLLINGALWLRGGCGPLRRRFGLAIMVSIFLVMPSLLAYLGFATLNRVSYGVFLVNEISERNFPRAVSALKRVDESPCDHRLITADEVQKVVAVSPSFRVVGETLATALAQEPNMDYSHAFSVMRVAALRDKGISARGTQRLFARIANEVEAACADGRLRCAVRASGGIVPLLCSSQWPLVPGNFLSYLRDYIAKVQHSGFNPWWSGASDVDRLHPVALANYEKITGQMMAGRFNSQFEFSQPATLEILKRQDQIRNVVGSIYAAVMPWLMLAGVVALFLRLRYWHDDSRPWWLFILLAMAGHVFVRVLAFSYLSAVDGVLNARLVSVCFPVAAAFAVLATAELRYFFLSPRPVSHRDVAPQSAESREKNSWVPATLALLVTLGYLYAGTRPGNEPAAQSPVIAQSGSLKFSESGEEYIEMDGRRIEILPQRQGWLDNEAGWLRGESAIFDGWAKDVNDHPAKAILLFVNGQLLHTAIPTIPISSLERGFPEEMRVGFSFALPRRVVDGGIVRVFALLASEKAGELNYPASYPYRH
jgi:hypothetical protein